MDLFLNPKRIETMENKRKKRATALRSKCCILFVFKKEMVGFLFYEKETQQVTSASRIQILMPPV